MLTDRLASLMEAGVLRKEATEGKREAYALTPKGRTLWPVLRALTVWGDDNCAPDGPIRLFRHTVDHGLLDADGRCEKCAGVVDVADTVMEAGPGLAAHPEQPAGSIRLLQPLRP